MKKLVILGIICCLFSAAWAQKPNVPIVDLKPIERILNQQSDTLYVLNFWATWCVPCIKELPYFESLTARHPNKKLKVILISQDFLKQYETRLLPFIAQKNIQSEVWLLSGGSENTWIPKIDSDWSGEIPATLFYQGSTQKRMFHAGAFTQESLDQMIKHYE